MQLSPQTRLCSVKEPLYWWKKPQSYSFFFDRTYGMWRGRITLDGCLFCHSQNDCAYRTCQTTNETYDADDNTPRTC